MTVSGEPADEAGGFRLYAGYIAEQLANQEARKKSLEDRAATVITTSGVLATIMLGLTSFAAKQRSLEITGVGRPDTFLCACACARVRG
jgi:hypothetical protein